MTTNHFMTILKHAARAGSILFSGALLAFGQQQINLTAGPTNATMADGSAVPMWGYSCDAIQVAGSLATCAALNPTAAAAVPPGWSPVVITIPTGQTLQINLTNNLAFTPLTPTGAATNYIPTSLTIVGQLGGGLGNVLQRTTTVSPDHSNAQAQTWPIAGTPPGVPPVGVNPPPTQAARVQSVATEVAAAGATVVPPQCASPCSSLTWTAPRPGTYLLESGTHPSIQGPMGLYGMVVVTCAPGDLSGCTAGTAYTGVSYAADAKLLFSEIDPVQNNAVSAAVNTAGFSETAVWTGGPNAPQRVAAVNVTNGGSYLSAPTVSITSSPTLGGTQATATASLSYSLASITGGGGSGYTVNDTVNIIGGGGDGTATAVIISVSGTGAITGVSLTNPGAGFTSVPKVTVSSATGSGASLTATLTTMGSVTTITVTNGGSGYYSAPTVTFSPSGALATAVVTLGACGSGNSSTTPVACYPPAVNYTPLYYLINGSGFNKTNAAASLVATSPATGVSGNVLVRLVNAGMRMHVPSIVGSLTTPSGASTASPGFSLIAEDGNVLPGVQRVQSEVFMAAGKTYDVMINTPAAGGTALPIYDRELSLSGNATARDAGMLAYINVNSVGLPSSGVFAPAATAVQANPDTYNSVLATRPLVVTDPAKGVLANDVNVYGVQVVGTAPAGLTLNRDGTFTYTGGVATSFTYCGNGATTGPACALVTLGACTGSCLEAGSGITVANISYNASVAGYIGVKSPGVLSVDSDGAGYPLTVAVSTVTASAGLNVTMSPDGGFVATLSTVNTTATVATFTYKAQNSQGTQSATTATVTINFPAPSGLQVSVVDGATKAAITDYRWIIEEDRTFYVDPNCTQNPPPAGCPSAASGIVPVFGTNFHTSYMPVVATGCTGVLSCESGQTIFDPATQAHIPAVCDIGNGICRPDPTGNGFTAIDPKQVQLDPTKRYYISVLPGDAANPFNAGNLGACPPTTDPAYDPAACGHGMGGAPIAAGQTAVTVLAQPTPFPPGKLSVFVFEDDFPLNGEHDAGGGIDVLATNEPGLGSFQITLFDDAGGTGDATGTPTYDMFNQPLRNSLAGTIDPITQLDACPVVVNPRTGMVDDPKFPPNSGHQIPDVTQLGITGMIVTCPNFESDGQTLSPLAGQAVVDNLYPGRYGVMATPAADRIARGEEWLQTNTLDGQKAHDSFIRIGEPQFFQEFGPAGHHVSIGFANPKIINDRKTGVCGGTDLNLSGANCNHSVTGVVTTERMSRTPDQRLYSSGDNSSFSFTQCYVSLGDTDGEDFAFTKCNSDGSFTLTGIPDGNWRITVFDQWNDMLVDGLSTPIGLGPGFGLCSPTSTASNCDLGQIAMNQWQANIYTQTFFDANGDGIRQDSEAGLTLVPTNIRFRDGSFSNFNNTDLSGNAGFNEVFPLFSWYVIETDATRYKNTGTHVVYDAGGPADGTCVAGVTAPCGSSTTGTNMANTAEVVSVPTNLRVPGAVYCKDADCSTHQGGTTPGPLGGGTPSDPPSVCTTDASGLTTCSTQLSTGRIDPPWVTAEGWQGFSGQNSFIEFGKRPYAVGENGGIRGDVMYASTRPFDDVQFNLHNSWTPQIPNVKMNLYQEGTAPDGTVSLKLVDTTFTTSWDAWAQGFHADPSTPNSLVPNMNCPGQGTNPSGGTNPIPDLFYFSLYNQPMWLDFYSSQHGGPAPNPLPYNAQFKCYDGMHNWNQIQPAPFDGSFQFPSITGMNPTTGAPTNTNCTICVTNPDASDPYRYGGSATPVAWTSGHGTPMLPAGKYVVEVVLPPGYELMKEEDKNILIGDNYIAPVTVQFPGLGGAIYIVPDQASVDAAFNANQGSLSAFNPNNYQDPTQALGRISSLPSHEGDTGSVETFWPCVGQKRIVPDYLSLFPQAVEVAPFAGATRNLCDRKEIVLDDQTSALTKFYLFTSVHVTAHFTGVITDDFTSEFDPFSPQFGEKFSPANLPVAIKDWTGNEISRIYSDHWGTYDGLTYSTWEVNPPNPTGYGPTMMVTCMNDPGSGSTPDPLYNPSYSQFCYEIPFMPGQTQYMDTPVTPTSAFAGAGYNNPDCNYPDQTPAIKEVDGDGVGPWVSAAGHTLTITALGDQMVNNNAYSGPSATSSPFNQKTISRHYGFGGTKGTVTIGGISVSAANITTWTDTGIVLNVPAGVPTCTIQQQAQYGGSTAQCGELVITRADNHLQSIDTVTVTIGGKAPTHVAASASIQSAIDAAAPGDLIIIDPTCSNPVGPVACTTAGATTNSTATHQELVIMWKPVRLQGVGAASSVINANTHPAGKLDAWRQRVNCLFGLALNGQPYSANSPTATPVPPATSLNPYDPTGALSCPGTGWNYFNSDGGSNDPQVDRMPLEGVVGWDATVNGNLSELLQEPSLMGAYEGAGITVLSKGVRFPSCTGGDPNNCLVFGNGNDTGSQATESQFPLGTVPLTSSNADCLTTGPGATGYASNFQCNPSSIDGLSVTNSSQGGGGIFLHAWAHNMEIANNRVYNNTGTLTGGIVVGQGESPDALLNGNGGNPVGFDQQPWTCYPGGVVGGVQQVTIPGLALGTQLPYCYDTNVNVHHNYVTNNSSIGDEIFSGTPAGAGGVSFCIGADYYKFQYNWVCGNLSSGDGGGLAHIGFVYNGDIEHNTIIFNQSTNPTIATNGGGIIVMGAAPDGTNAAGPECGSVTDIDCAPGLSDGTGPNLKIDANLLMGNAAESGSGGGIRLQDVNGTEVVAFPLNPSAGTTGGVTYNGWNNIKVTNNIIANNVAGWDGGGVSLQDALVVDFINNTVMSNDTTASSGVLFNTLGAPLASAPGAPNPCPSNPCTTISQAQPAGLVTMANTSLLTAALAAEPPVGGVKVQCPTGHATGALANGNCMTYSVPVLYNDLFFQNRSFYIGVGGLGTGSLNQQNVVALFNQGTTTQAVTQPTADATTANGNGVVITGGTGACVTASYWDLGVRGDTGPTNHSGGITLVPEASFITSTAGYAGGGTGFQINSASNPTVFSQYCNGSRTPPEFKSLGYQVPPGIADATVPNPIFNLTPAATVDEGNNWINIAWGPLGLANPITSLRLGNYGPAALSPVIGYITAANSATTYAAAPTLDFFGTNRKANGAVDAGAVEFAAATVPPAFAFVTGGPLNFGPVGIGGSSAPQTLTLHNTGTAAVGGISVIVTSSPNGTSGSVFTRPAGAAGGTCGASLPAGGTCTINVVFSPTALGAYTGLATIAAANTSVSGSPVQLAGTGSTAALSATVTPNPLAFANQLQGTTSAAQTLTVTNTGNTSLAGGTFTFGGGTPQPFSRPAGAAGGTCVATLGVGASCTINVVFAPTTSAPFARTLTVAYTGATVTPTPVNLTGTGFYPVAPTTLNFPTTQLGQTSAPLNIAVSNQGTTPLTFTAITRAGTNPGQFTVPNFSNCNATLPFTLAAGASCTVTEAFAPTGAAGARSAALNFIITGGTNPYQVSLLGTAVAPSFTLAPGSLAFGNQPTRTVSPSQPVTLTNTGVGPLTVTAIGFTGTNPALFTQTNTCGTLPATVALGGSCTINVSFAPGATTAGAKSANLSVAATGATTQTTSLTGTATVTTAAEAGSGFTSSPANTTVKNGTVTITAGAGGAFTLTAAPTITVVGTANGTFSNQGGTCVSGLTVPAGGNCTVTATYTPTSASNTTFNVLLTGGGFTGATATATPNLTAN